MIKVALTVIVKNENRYLREWVEYYKRLGIDHIYIGDNNDSEGEQLETVLYDYLELPNPYITIINIKNRIAYQDIFYLYIYKEYGYKYDWMCFFDIDEFLYLKEDKTIQDYLSRDTFIDVDQIHVNWLIYDDNDLIQYDNRPVQERFTRISKYQLAFVKFILRCNIIKDLVFATHTAYPVDRNYPNNYLRTCSSNGKRWVDDVQCTYNTNEQELNDKQIALLKHYKTKSFKEFIERKLNIHSADNGNKVDKDTVIGLWKEINNFTDEHKKILEEYESRINSNS